MAGRWKANNDGSAYWDANDSGPNQVTPPPSGQPQTQSQQTQSPDYADPSRGHEPGGVTGNPWGAETQPAQAPPAAPNYGQAPPGFTQEKWADPNQGNSLKYQVGRMAASGMPIDQIAAGVGAKVVGNDKIEYPDGFVADIYKDYGGPNQQVQYTQVGGPGWGGDSGGSNTGAAVGAGGSFPGGAYPGSSAAGSIFGSSFGAGGSRVNSVAGDQARLGTNLPYGANAGNLYDTLMGRAGQSLNVSAKDPIIAGQVNSYRAEQERGARNYLEAQAESQGPMANLGAERRLASEHAAQATGGMQAQLMGQELTARRTEIQNALNQMGGLLTEEQKMALQTELSYLNAGLDQQRINNQNNQFLDDLGLRAEDRASYWDSLRSGLL